MKILREYFDNYEDDKVKLTVLDDKNRIKTVYTVETELDAKTLEAHLKSRFKAHSKIA